MKIAFDTLGENPKNPSSAINYLTEFVDFFKEKKDVQILLFVSSSNRNIFPKSKNIKQINCFFSNENILLRIFSQQILIPFYLLFHKADLLYSPLNSTSLLTATPVFLKINTMYTWDKIDIDSKRSFSEIIVNFFRNIYRKFFFYLSAKKAKIVVANSNFTKCQIVKHFKIDSSKIICSPEAYYYKFGTFKKKDSQRYVNDKFKIDFQYFIFPANMYEYKNHIGALNAYNRFLDKYKFENIHLLFVGRDESNVKNELLKMIDDSKINKRVHFIDYVSIDDVVHLINNAKALFFPSKNETFGKPLVEAMISSVPAVCSDIDALKEIAINDLLLADPDKIEDLAAKLFKSLNVGNDYLENARIKAEEYTYDNHFKKIFNFFRIEQAK
tara:strand:- start:8912 stop:10066 length:1155 start_codon:yes stop_codon:yes gene_type:complete